MVKTIKLFAFLGEQLQPEIKLDLPEALSKQAILAAVAKAYPLYQAEIATCNVALNQTFVTDETLAATEVSEIALIPPVSGG